MRSVASHNRLSAMRFVIAFGVVSLLADFVYSRGAATTFVVVLQVLALLAFVPLARRAVTATGRA